MIPEIVIKSVDGTQWNIELLVDGINQGFFISYSAALEAARGHIPS